MNAFFWRAAIRTGKILIFTPHEIDAIVNINTVEDITRFESGMIDNIPK